MASTELSVSSRALIETCRSLGFETERMLEAASLTAMEIADPDARLPVEKVGALWQSAYAIAQDPDLALHVAEALPFGAYKVLDFLGWNASSLGEAVSKISEYFPLIHTGIEMPIHESDSEFALELRSNTTPLGRASIEFAFAALVTRIQKSLGCQWSILRIDFAFDRPEDVAEHQRIFSCPMQFGMSQSLLVMERAVWEQPTSGDPTLFTVLEEHARLLLAKLPKGSEIVQTIRSAIAAQLRGGDPSLESVARELSMSPRTLQRRLKDEDLTYASLLDEMRLSTARTYLADPKIAISEVAYLLGFSEPSSFHRAVKRWTGQTPSQLRASAPV